MAANGMSLSKQTDFFRPYPDPHLVFASDVDKHMEYFLPLASLNLSALKAEWEGTLHFVSPIEPYDRCVGEGRELFYTHYTRMNWIAFRVKDGLYEYEGDWGLFVKDEMPDFYSDVLIGYQEGKSRFDNSTGLSRALKWVTGGLRHSVPEPRELAFELAGHSSDGNWTNTSDFDVVPIGEYLDEHGEPAREMRPVTKDGRPFDYIGSVPAGAYVIGENKARYYGTTTLLFFDPVSQIALTTFDWS